MSGRSSYIATCPACNTNIKVVASLAFRISGENRHHYTCSNCNASLSGQITQGHMILEKDHGEHEARAMMERML